MLRYSEKNNEKNKKIVDISEAKNHELQTFDTYNEFGLEQVLNILDKNLKEIIVMYYYDDISVQDISKIIDIPQGTVKSRLARARSKLYEILSKEGDYNVR